MIASINKKKVDYRGSIVVDIINSILINTATLAVVLFPAARKICQEQSIVIDDLKLGAYVLVASLIIAIAAVSIFASVGHKLNSEKHKKDLEAPKATEEGSQTIKDDDKEAKIKHRAQKETHNDVGKFNVIGLVEVFVEAVAKKKSAQVEVTSM